MCPFKTPLCVHSLSLRLLHTEAHKHSHTDTQTHTHTHTSTHTHTPHTHTIFEEKGEQKGEERKIPQKTRRSQFWCDVSYDQALFIETHFALCTYHASGVLSVNLYALHHTCYTCLPCHVAAGCGTPAARHQKKPELHLLAKRCKEMQGGPRK